jgi:hypothetical protein
MPVLKKRFPSPGTPCAGGRHHTTNNEGVLAVCPDVAELLAVVALSKPVLKFVRLYPDCNVAEVGQFEKSWDFAVLGKVLRNKGRLTICDPSGGVRPTVVISLTLMTSKPRLIRPPEISWKVTNCSLNWFFRYWEISEVGKVVGL